MLVAVLLLPLGACLGEIGTGNAGGHENVALTELQFHQASRLVRSEAESEAVPGAREHAREQPKLAQISAHGDLEPRAAASTDSRQRLWPRLNRSSALQESVRSSSREPSEPDAPTVSCFEEEGCTGQPSGFLSFPRDANMAEDHCVKVKMGKDGKAFMKIICEDTGVSKMCIFLDANDTECAFEEPVCFVVQAEDSLLVSKGECVKSRRMPDEEDGFIRWSGFQPDEIQWSPCMAPELPKDQIITYAAAGFGAGCFCLLMSYGVHRWHENHKGKQHGGGGFGGGGGGGGFGGKGYEDMGGLGYEDPGMMMGKGGGKDKGKDKGKGFDSFGGGKGDDFGGGPPLDLFPPDPSEAAKGADKGFDKGKGKDKGFGKDKGGFGKGPPGW